MNAAYTAETPMRVALAGFGNVGRAVGRGLSEGRIAGAKLTAISSRDLGKARLAAADLDPPPLVVPVAELVDLADVIVECATAEAMPEIVRTALDAGKILVLVSMGGFAAHTELLDEVARHGGRIRIATGALPGLDAVRIAAEGPVRSVVLTTRVRPESLAGEAYVRERGFDFHEPPAVAVQVYEGTARQAALAFPRHFNVAVSLSLAGIGLDRTLVELIADPDISGTVHRIDVDSDAFQLSLESRNQPSATNPRTSRAVAPSVLAAVRSLIAPVQVGS